MVTVMVFLAEMVAGKGEKRISGSVHNMVTALLEIFLSLTGLTIQYVHESTRCKSCTNS